MRLDPSVVESQTLAWTAKVGQLRKAGRRIISLGLGEPDFATPPHIVAAAHKAMKDGFTTYSSAPGLEELRFAIAKKLERDNAVAAKADEIVVTPGAKNALYLAAAALLEPGDEAVVLTPGYVSNVPIVKLAEPQCVLTDVALKGPEFSLDVEALNAAVTDKTKVLLVNYPNNPTGRMLSAAEGAALVDLLKRRPRLHLISDEIYERLTLTPLAAFSPASSAAVRERVVTVNGFSKAYAMTGWRVGYAHAARPVAQRILKIHQQLNSHVAPFIQLAALAGLEGPHDHLREFLERLRAAKAAYGAFLAKYPKARASTPEGGFFGFIDVSAAGLSSDAFATRLLEQTGVAVLPGASFGPAFDAYCRVSLAVPAAELREALDLLGGFLTEAAK